MISDAQYQTWLRELNAKRCLLVEIKDKRRNIALTKDAHAMFKKKVELKGEYLEFDATNTWGDPTFKFDLALEPGKSYRIEFDITAGEVWAVGVKYANINDAMPNGFKKNPYYGAFVGGFPGRKNPSAIESYIDLHIPANAESETSTIMFAFAHQMRTRIKVSIYEIPLDVYVSSHPFISTPTDQHPNRAYLDVLSNSVDITARLDSTVSIGDIELVDDGSISHYKNLEFAGRSVRFLLGAPDWRLDEFRLIANQRCSGLLESRRGLIKLGMQDAAAVLDKPMQRTTLDDGRMIPLVLGEVLGGKALRVDTQTLNYAASQLALSSLVVRDGVGTILTSQSTLATGRLKLFSYTPRELHLESKEPHDTAFKICQWVGAQYGLTLGITEQSLPDYKLGLYFEGGVSGREILDKVALAIGGFWRINLAGKLIMQQLKEPTSADFELNIDDIEYDKIALVRTEPAVKSMRVQYAQNQKPIAEVAGSIEQSNPTQAHRLRTQFLSLQSGSGDDIKQHTLAISNKAHAQTELNRRMQLRSKRRDIYEITAFVGAAQIQPGIAIKANHPAVNKTGVVLSVRQSIIKDKVHLEVWF